MSQIKEKQSAHFWNVYYLTTKCVLFLDTTDHPTTIRKLAKSREKKRIHKTQHRRKRAEILKHSLFFKKKKSLKKRKFNPNFFENFVHPKTQKSFFSLFSKKTKKQEDSTSFLDHLVRNFENLLASLGIANFKLDCDSYLFLFSLSLTLSVYF